MAEPTATPETTSSPDWAQIDEGIISDCPLCGYNLRGLIQPRCPECGYRFDWNEMLDPNRRLHPYLFEHHPLNKVWSFCRTLVGGLLPGRFWRKLHPAQPSYPRRLALYGSLVGLLVTLYRLGTAYRLYLRFDHPFSTVLAAHVIALLLLCNLVSLYGNFAFG